MRRPTRPARHHPQSYADAGPARPDPHPLPHRKPSPPTTDRHSHHRDQRPRHVYISDTYRREILARAACLEAVVTDAAATGAHMLVLEQDDSLLRWDRKLLYELTRKTGCADTLRYEHHRGSE